MEIDIKFELGLVVNMLSKQENARKLSNHCFMKKEILQTKLCNLCVQYIEAVFYDYLFKSSLTIQWTKTFCPLTSSNFLKFCKIAVI